MVATGKVEVSKVSRVRFVHRIIKVARWGGNSVHGGLKNARSIVVRPQIPCRRVKVMVSDVAVQNPDLFDGNANSQSVLR